ncbi:uncharacterized protein PAC_06505 [Phialocephala subalpina]|uniref:Uncharacterized protein n=1 Tax=Phialocephala subalpina TaxID=576137 RepID=A0A1L7WV13_9HELO|nr:uncharacterized protein PAC_06505 [Phialocephala subalpina]
MSVGQLLRRPFRFSSSFTQPRIFRTSLRNQSSTPSPSSSPASQAAKETRTRARINRLHTRLPKFLQPYTRGLLNAPISHLVSFLILHEITAVVPLVGLAGLFHYTNWLPRTWVEGRWVGEGVERFGRYFGRKGWFGFTKEGRETNPEGDGEVSIESEEKRWHVNEQGSRILVEVATAYAITKVFLPARILLSVWGTPWFARVVVGRVGGLFGKGMKGNVTGLGASAGGVGGGMGKGVGVGEGVKKMPP